MSRTSTLADRCWFLTGPTAGGKSALGLILAKKLNAQIVSMDSMAVYRGMDIGTAKPSPAERRQVPHHMIDLVDPQREFSLAEYLEQATAAVAAIEQQGQAALFVGGTPLYLKALLRGMFSGPGANWELRQRYQQLAATQGASALHARLAQVDPAAAARLHPNDTRRLIRALEVYEQTGLPISAQQRQFERPRDRESCRVFCLEWPRAVLHERINARVDAMFAEGLVNEVRSLLAAGPFSHTAAQALGYREVLAHLAGEHSLEETMALVKQRTRQFAKRQETWFRSLIECRAVPMSEACDLNALADAIVVQGAR